MARTTILSDDLLRQLVAVGQVDVLVGVPTFNNAATIEPVITTLHTGLAQHFPRERTVLINPDGGSDDGTMERVRAAPMAAEERRGSSTLRTTHRVSAPYPGLPGRAAGVRAVFAAADLLQARTVVVVDPEVMSITPEWIAALARPVWTGDADFVLPIHPRERFEGPLVTQLVRPLVGTAYARRLCAGLAGAFGCSGRFAARLTAHPMWEEELTRPALDVWMVASALADDLRVVQAHLGPCQLAPRPPRMALPELFEQVVGAVFASLDRHAAVWTARNGAVVELPVIGEPREPARPAAAVDPLPLAERFRAGVRDLTPLLRDILAPRTLERLHAAAAADGGAPSVPDGLWVTTVYEFAAATRRGVMTREHLTQALVPLYLGRTASFFAEIERGDDAAHRERLSALEREYEGRRPYLLECWNTDGGR